MSVTLLVLVASLLAGCTPRFDWREHRAADGLVATFPGRVQNLTRAVELDGRAFQMRMDAARVGELSFAVGTIRLADADADDATRSAVRRAIEAGLLRNIAASAPTERRLVMIAAGAPAVPVEAVALRADGTGPYQALRINARLFARGPYAYQVLVAGPRASMEQPDVVEAVETFLSSLSLS